MLGLQKDLNKVPFEAYGTELGLVYQEISHCLNHLKRWMRPQVVPTSIAHFPTRSKILSVPKGDILVISTWNYPFLLTLVPVVDALAAGNRVVVKLPKETKYSSEVLSKILNHSNLSEWTQAVSTPDEKIIPELIELNTFNHILFTGSLRIGRLIYQKAAEKMIPVTLEMGGKSPCIVDETAPLKTAAKRIAWAKSINAGQTCVAPDYLLIHRSVHDVFVDELKRAFDQLKLAESGDYCSMVNQHHFNRIQGLLEQSPVVYACSSKFNFPNQVFYTSPALAIQIEGKWVGLFVNEREDVRCSIIGEYR